MREHLPWAATLAALLSLPVAASARAHGYVDGADDDHDDVVEVVGRRRGPPDHAPAWGFRGKHGKGKEGRRW